jgi:hypothetical protein
MSREISSIGNPDGVARKCRLPNDEFVPAWTSIKVGAGVRERLLAQSLLSFTMRQKLPFELAPLHGLIRTPLEHFDMIGMNSVDLLEMARAEILHIGVAGSRA